MDLLENSNPNIFKKSEPRKITVEELQENIADPIDDREIFDLIRDIRDPEHPLTLEELHVLELKNIVVNSDRNEVTINFTPTIPHCSMATLIGLSIRVRLLRSLSPRYKVSVEITPGTHASEHAINKQLADKERVAAALENQHLCGVINECIAFSKEKYELLSRGVNVARDENFENVIKHPELDILHEYEDIIKIIHKENVLSENTQSIQIF